MTKRTDELADGFSMTDREVEIVKKVLSAYPEPLGKDCLPFLDEVIKEEPNNYTAFTHRGRTRYYHGLYKEAVEDFSKCISMQPYDSNAWAWRANTHYFLGDFEKALSDFVISLQIKPDEWVNLDKAGRLMFYFGHQQQALEYEVRAVKLATASDAARSLILMFKYLGLEFQAQEVYDANVRHFKDDKKLLDRCLEQTFDYKQLLKELALDI